MQYLRKHYEIVIVACAFMLVFVNVGFASTSFNVYQSYIVELPGVGNVGGSFVVTLRTLVALVCMLFTDRFFTRINPRAGIGIATLCTCASFVVFGFSRSMLGLSVGGILAGVGYGLGGMVAATYLIGNWYSGKVGSISGFVTSGSGFAAILVPIFAGWIIEEFSLSTAFFVEAAASLLAAAFLSIFIRMRPSDMGLDPISGASSGRSGKKYHSGLFNLISARRAERIARRQKREALNPKVKLSAVPLPRFAYISLIFALVLLGGISVAGFNYFGILLTTQGIDPVLAATMISLAGIFLTFSKFAVGMVCDRFGTLIGSAVFFVLLILSMALCSIVGSGGTLEAAFAAAMIGIGMPLGTAGISLWSLELSSPEQRLKNVKRFQLAYTFGGFALNMMPGILAQSTGTYTTTYMVLTVLSVVCAAIVLTIYARHVLRARKAYQEIHPEQ